ncbi:MAG TPA: oxidoreductase [Terriglobales bacterium]|nr:oxidoreductase [Terriglobales bacterium]
MNSENTEIPVGLIGFGVAGRVFHAPTISAVPGLRLAAILQRSRGDAAAQYPNALVVSSLEDLLAIDEIKLVIIATSNTSHFDLARQCLLAGRDVVVDKPFTTSYQEAYELVRISRERGRLLTVFQNARWHGDFQTVRKLVNAGTLGRLVFYEAHFDRFRPQLRPGAWRERDEPGSGVFFDLGPHLIDQAMVLFGTPEAITATIRIERDNAVVDDAFYIALHYKSLRVELRATMLAGSAPGLAFALHGTLGSYVKYGREVQEEALRRGELPIGDTWGREPEEKWGSLYIERDSKVVVQPVPTETGDYRRYYENVRDAILGRANLDVTGEQALNVMRALELARESSRKQCTLVWRNE